MIKKILFLCTGNSARSQMAEGLLRHLAGERYESYSAGTKPSGLNPFAVAAMREIGIDIAKQYSKSVDVYFDQRFDHVITLCSSARQTCPFFPGGTVPLHWDLEDPAEAVGNDSDKLDTFIKARDEIRARIERFVEEQENG